MQTGTRSRGFASMNQDKQREIARKGGRAAHAKGTAHEFTADEARAAGRKGGERVSTNREHMSRIGRIGGKASAARRIEPEASGEEPQGQDAVYPGTASSDAVSLEGDDQTEPPGQSLESASGGPDREDFAENGGSLSPHRA